MVDDERPSRGGAKVVRFPITFDQRKRNQMGSGYVPCMVSGRWLHFPKRSGGHFSEGEFLTIAVMTDGSGEGPRKICELVVTREDILGAIDAVADRGVAP